MIRKIVALTAFFFGKTAALTALNRKNSNINGVELERHRRYRRLTGKIVALTLLNGKNSGVSGVEPEKQRH